jgi:RNA polymerase sigma factor (sigma-70 family)
MHGGSSRAVVRHLRTLYQFGVVGSLSDESLLDRFLARRDEAAEEAFAELVQRHGPMVLGVSRRILGDVHEAEDVFQATFLVLARKAATVVRRERVASWLYAVAVRTAKESRDRAARRQAREERVSTPILVEPPDDGFPAELRDILDEELSHLPTRQRGPVVLCELKGLSRPEAARQLGIPEGTLSSRLARAKVRLRERLASRGVSLPAATISAILIRESRAVTVPLSLLESTVQVATLVAAGPSAAGAISASVVSLSEGVIKTMLVTKLKGIALAVGTMTAVISSAVVLGQSGQPGVGPGRENVPTKAESRSGEDGQPGSMGKVGILFNSADRDDRAAALEKKLDRVLEALERLSSREEPPFRTHGRVVNSVSRGSSSERPPSATDGPPDQPGHGKPEAPSGNPPDQPAQGKETARGEGSLQGQRELRPVSPNLIHGELDFDGHLVDPRTLSDRVQALEQQMQQVQQQLERLDEQLKSLDARVGGGRGERAAAPVRK